MDKPARDNKANQKNPNNPEFKGNPPPYCQDRGDNAQINNRANQKNPNHKEFKG